jgi:hypothetical protein
MKPHPFIEAARRLPCRVIRPKCGHYKLGGGFRKGENVLDQFLSNATPAMQPSDGKPANGVDRRLGGKEQSAQQGHARRAIRLSRTAGSPSVHVPTQRTQKAGIVDHRPKERLDLGGEVQPRRYVVYLSNGDSNDHSVA